AAARTQTNNNLRQCAIAIHNYHGTFNKFPHAAGLSQAGLGNQRLYANAGEERSMWFHLLPYVEADNIYKNNVHNAVVGAYLAPSDPYTSTPDGKLNFAGNIRLFGYKTLSPKQANNAVNLANGNPTGATLAGALEPIMNSDLTLTRIADG